MDLQAATSTLKGLDEGCLSLDGLASILTSGITVELHQLDQIKAGCLDGLDLANKNVLERVDASALLLDLLGDGLRDKLVDKALEVRLGGLSSHDLNHLPADSPDLGRLGLAGLADLIRSLLGEGNGKHAEGVAISGLDIGMGLNQGLPLADKGAELVPGHVHTVEVGKEGLALDLLTDKLNLAVVEVLGTLKISEGNSKDTALKRLGGNLGTSGTGDRGLAGNTVGKHGRSLDVIPLFTGEGVDSLLLAAGLDLLAELLVLTDSHFVL